MAERQVIRDPGLAERHAAARVLGTVLVERQFLDAAMAEGAALLEPPQRARVRRIVDGVLRCLPGLDALLSPLLRKDTPARVRHVLRVAAWEILVDGIPVHAAVDGAVRSVKNTRKIAHLAGLTNAVARKLGEMTFEPEPTRLPSFLRKPLVARYSGTVVTQMEAVFAETPPLDITLKDPASADHWASELGAVRLPTGSLRMSRPGQVSALPGFEAGAWWVQDAAAAFPVRLLGDMAGASVLDLCAAPGGKTLQAAALGASVTAVDVSDARLDRVRENLGRIELNADVVVADALSYGGGPFDVVILDAPCSATGTLRRHPDLPYVKKDLDLAPVLELQKQMIAQATGLIKPGGRLLYCTCSLLPSEGEAQVWDLMQSGWTIANQRPEGCEDAWFDAQGHLRLRPDYWPDTGGMDGFFATVLQKPA